jgi:branched-chain amino acid transport system substrate-binding protein
MRKCKGFILMAAVMLAVSWSAVAGAADIVIGYSGPLSGPAAEYGEDCLNGVDLAIKELNAKGGITVKGRNYNFRLEKMDDRVDPATAVSNAVQLRKEHKAIAIFNPVANTIAAMMKINQEKRNEFLIMAYTSMPQISEMGNKLLLALTQPFTIYVKTQADIAWERGWRKGAMVVTAGTYGDTWRKAFGEEWLKKGGAITFDQPANYYTRTDFAAPLAGALETNPDFLLIGGPSSTTALLIEQARARGFEGGFVMIEQAKMDTIAQVMEKPLLLEGVIGLARVSDVTFPASAAFTFNYTNNYKRQLTWESVVNYIAMHALAKAIVAASTTDDAIAIRAALPRVFPMLGDQYPLEYFGVTSNGRLISAAAVQTMKHGRFTQPTLYAWWPKTQKEFEQVQKTTKMSIPMTWRNTGDM